MVTILGLLLLLGTMCFSMFMIPFALHRVDEGCVGVYWHGGAIMEQTTRPGYHLMLPGFTTSSSLQVTLKTSSVKNIPCGTSSGLILYFSKVEVVHQLSAPLVVDTLRNYSSNFESIWLYDRVHHEINQICSVLTLHEVYITKFNEMDELLMTRLTSILAQWAPGIRIISVRLTKPKIPERIRKAYEEIDEQKTRLLIATQKQRTVLKAAETEKQAAVWGAKKQAAVSAINLQKMEERKKSQVEIAKLEDTMHKDRSKEVADAAFYRALKVADGFKARLSQTYLEFLRTSSQWDNTEIFHGDGIPNTMINYLSATAILPANRTDARH